MSKARSAASDAIPRGIRAMPGAGYDVLLLAVLWCVAVLLVNPVGNFPLNDDWSYGMAVRRLLEERAFRPTGWTAMTLVSQALWGALFCAPFGFSFTALRFSTLALALTGVVGLYLLLRQRRAGRAVAVIGALTLAFDPLYFALAHTFMTDVPFTACMILALVCFVEYLRREADAYLLAGVAFAIVATLCRQLGVFLPIAFGVALLAKRGFGPRYLVRAALPAIATFGVLGAFNSWMRQAGVTPRDYDRNTTMLLGLLGSGALWQKWYDLATNACMVVIYLGVLLFPVLLLPGVARRRLRGLAVAAFVISLGILLLMLKHIGKSMPLSGNVLGAGGIGPVTLIDVYILELPHVPALPAWIWVAVTALGLAGAALLLARVAALLVATLADLPRLRSDERRLASLFFLLTASIYVIPIVIGGFFDRYLLPLLPLVAAALLPVSRDDPTSGDRAAQGHTVSGTAFHSSFRLLLAKRGDTALRVQAAAAGVVLACLATYSIAGTHDYLAWNRARWQALGHLTAGEGISAALIDGGFEFNGWNLYDDNWQITAARSWWWVKDDLYLVTMGEVAGYDVVRAYPFARWMPPIPGSILVLRRAGTPSGLKSPADPIVPIGYRQDR